MHPLGPVEAVPRGNYSDYSSILGKLVYVTRDPLPQYPLVLKLLKVPVQLEACRVYGLVAARKLHVGSIPRRAAAVVGEDPLWDVQMCTFMV